MKVLLLNGSPHEKGCTYTALCEVAAQIEKAGIETEIFHVGKKAVIGCQACRKCTELKRCVFDSDTVNEFVKKAAESDGFVFGSPVYYAAASGQVTAFLNRAFYSGKYAFEYKPGAAVVSCRRGGSTAALEQLNKYMTISNMPLVSSSYWNMVHGNTPEEVRQDHEGMQTMRTVGQNMVWLLRCIEAGKKAGVAPEKEAKVMTNFIR